VEFPDIDPKELEIKSWTTAFFPLKLTNGMRIVTAGNEPSEMRVLAL
jgi:hypothetical protein